jgi:hypothetical protein
MLPRKFGASATIHIHSANAAIVTGHRSSGANPVADARPAAKAVDLGKRITTPLLPLRVTGAMLCPKPAPMILFALTTALLFPPETTQGLRCVAVLAVNREQSRANDAAFYTAIVGAEAMDATGMTREAIRDYILDQVKIVRRNKAGKAEIDQCVVQMKARVAIERVTTK